MWHKQGLPVLEQIFLIDFGCLRFVLYTGMFVAQYLRPLYDAVMQIVPGDWLLTKDIMWHKQGLSVLEQIFLIDFGCLRFVLYTGMFVAFQDIFVLGF
jgi:hypothetical protein